MNKYLTGQLKQECLAWVSFRRFDPQMLGSLDSREHRDLGSMWQTEVFFWSPYTRISEKWMLEFTSISLFVCLLSQPWGVLWKCPHKRSNTYILDDLSVAKLEMKINHHSYLFIEPYIFFVSEVYPEMLFQIPKFVSHRTLHIGYNYRGREMVYGRQRYSLIGARIV